MEITLIGGKHHRQKIEVPNRTHVWHMAEHEPFIARFEPSNFVKNNIKESTYRQIDCILGEYGIFPKNCFLLDSINPVEFLINLVKDYVR